MASMIVSGAGTSTANETYVENGTQNGKPYYEYFDQAIQWNGIAWQITGSSGTITWYESTEDVATPNLVSSWDIVDGSAPAPTVSEEGGGPVAPTVTTSAVTAITTTGGTGNGDVTSDGGATVTERGVVVNTTGNPTTSDTKFTTSGTTGSFNVAITGRNPSTLYYVRAYAINSAGTGYGSEVNFRTAKMPQRKPMQPLLAQ